MANSLLVHGTRYCTSYARQIRYNGRSSAEIWTNLSVQNGLRINRLRILFFECSMSPIWICLRPDSIANTHCISPVPDNQAFEIDALSMNWNFLQAYAFPDTLLIPPILAKIRQSRCRIVLIAHRWPQPLWFSEVLQLLVSAPIRLLFFPNVLTQARGKFQYQNLQRLALYAWELSSNQLEVKVFAKHCKVRLKIKTSKIKTSIYSESLWCKHGSCTPIDVIKRRLIRSRPI